MVSLASLNPMDVVSADVLGPLPVTNDKNRYILGICCHLTNWSEYYPVPDLTAKTMAHVFVEEWVL